MLDCCRVKTKKVELSRGGDSEDLMEPETGNLKIIFGCSPGDLVIADSKLSKNIDKEVRRHVQENGGVFKTIDN